MMNGREGAYPLPDLPKITYFWCGLLWGYAHLRWGIYGTLIGLALVLPPLARYLRFSLSPVIWRKRVRTIISYCLEGIGWIVLIFSVINL
ncbi:MAG: hypothetical protein D6736_14305 [Nitrospinota bacterium]|nr:MAG: hypothetical protein D6736_14305 [Nitrospinota bacterium]